jgi:hypothetical protein
MMRIARRDGSCSHRGVSAKEPFPAHDVYQPGAVAYRGFLTPATANARATSGIVPGLPG